MTQRHFTITGTACGGYSASMKQITLRLPDDLHARLKELAEHEH
ncbi:hypothetical protein ACI2LC_28185 [Nonomuraea wenchangensis]